MVQPSDGAQLRELLDLARSVARQAADLVHLQRAEAVTDVATKSTETDPVTAADRAAEELIVTILRTHRPQDRLLGEESGEHESAEGPEDGQTGRVRWLIDPIDGTVNYLYGLAYHAVSIAAEIDGLAVVGVVRNAATGDEWTAVRGQGAWRAGRRLTGSTASRLEHSLVGTGFGYDAARRAHQARVLVDLVPRVRDIRRFGSAALDLCLAAEGQLDAYFEKGLGAWDLGAGGLIASEAGLRVTGLAGAPAGPEMVLAAPPAIHPDLHDLLVRLDAAGGA